MRRKNSRSSGVGRGQFVCMVNRPAVRGFPSIRHAAIRAWNATSKGGTSCGNSSRVTLVKSRNAIGRDCRSANRTPAMGGASCHCVVMSEAHHTIKRDKLTWIARPRRRTAGERPGAWRVSWGVGLRRRPAQRTMVLEKGENGTMDVGIVLAHNHMPVALFPEQLLVRGLEPGIDQRRAVRSDGRIATRLDE